MNLFFTNIKYYKNNYEFSLNFLKLLKASSFDQMVITFLENEHVTSETVTKNIELTSLQSLKLLKWFIKTVGEKKEIDQIKKLYSDSMANVLWDSKDIKKIGKHPHYYILDHLNLNIFHRIL